MWQRKQRQLGKCVICGCRASKKNGKNVRYCFRHRILQREAQRIRMGNVRRNDSITYRIERRLKKRKKS